MDYVEQTHHDLVYMCMPGEIPPGSVTLASAVTEKEIDGFSISFGVLSESHFVKVERDGKHLFTELFSCVDLDAPCLYKEKSSESVFSFAEKIEGIEYSFVMYKLLDVVTCKDVLTRGPSDELIVEFPNPEGVEGPRPYTAIHFFDVDDGKAEIETIHTYPNLGVSVRTISKFWSE